MEGAVPLSDLRQAEELLYTATAQIPQIEQSIQQQENALRFLLGQNPGPVAHTAANALAAPPQDLPPGLPSQLLERRPDIQQSEQQLVAANAQIGVARAQFFPQISISASAGLGGNEFSNLFDLSGRHDLRHRIADAADFRGRQTAAGSFNSPRRPRRRWSSIIRRPSPALSATCQMR